jgi:hypothetical protein
VNVAPHTRTLAVERILKKHPGAAPDAAAGRVAEGALGHALGVVDRALGASTHLAGEAFSLADVSLMPYVASLPMLGAEHLLRGLPSLEGWWRPGERTGVLAEDRRRMTVCASISAAGAWPWCCEPSIRLLDSLNRLVRCEPAGDPGVYYNHAVVARS